MGFMKPSTYLVLTMFAAPVLAAAPAPTAITWAEAVKRAENENPEILGARENLRAAEAQKAGAYGGFLPTIKASAGYENTDRSGISGVPTTTGTAWTAGINGSWNLF